jgi:hypothetical protein
VARDRRGLRPATWALQSARWLLALGGKMAAAMSPQPLRATWLFSPAEDLLAFLAPTLVSVLLLALIGDAQHAPLSPLGWLLAVVCVDVAHVWATIYRVYTVPGEVRRRPWLYLGMPALAYGLGVALHSLSALTFWRALASLAVYHFVRQQYGWIALCGRRAPSPRWARLDRWLDGAAVYIGTLYPIVYWHAHLPRRFHWFVPRDFFLPAPAWLASLFWVAWLLIGGLWLARQILRTLDERSLHMAKLLVMGSTWLSWYLGIVHFNSDFAFTVCNVLPHGVPYFILLYRYRTSELRERELPAAPKVPSLPSLAGQPGVRRPPHSVLAWLLFLLPLLALAFVEEGLWDRLVWHDHAMLFPLPEIDVPAWLLIPLVPLLSLPQSAHYLLDAWIWRVGPQNPDLRRRIGL